MAIRCAGFADARGALHASDSLLVQTTGPRSRRILAIGPHEQVRQHPAWASARPIDRTGWVLAPALANAHAHLDLTHVGPRPVPPGGFVEWIGMVRQARRADPAGIGQSVAQGIDLLRRGGTVAVGDIAGSVNQGPSTVPWSRLQEARLHGVSFLEFFALSPDGAPRLDEALRTADRCRSDRPSRDEPAGRGLRVGLQPHAPYSVSLGAYARAVRAGLPTCTHLAEVPEERRLVATGDGPLADMLQRMGLWNEAYAQTLGKGRSPVAHLGNLLAGMLVVHANGLDDADIHLLAQAQAKVAYCPRASDAFQAPMHFGPHRYADLLAAGVPVALGTDSIITLPPEAVQARGLCVLDEARHLRRRDGTAVGLLLEMLYRHGPAALGLDPAGFALTEGGEVLGLIAVELDSSVRKDDAAQALLESSGRIEFL